MGMRERPDWIWSIVIAYVGCLSPKFSHSFTKEHSWHLFDEQDEGWHDAKLLVCINSPDLCRSSIGTELSPVGNVEILAPVENAPRRLYFQAKTQGCESVKWTVGLFNSLIWFLKCSSTCRIPAASPWYGSQLALCESKVALKKLLYSYGSMLLVYRISGKKPSVLHFV